MVSVTVEVVSVRDVMLPCWKLGTTGTAFAVLTFARASATTNVARSFFISHVQSIEISETNWPVALVPAPPAVSVITPAEVIVPARLPATPPL